MNKATARRGDDYIGQAKLDLGAAVDELVAISDSRADTTCKRHALISRQPEVEVFERNHDINIPQGTIYDNTYRLLSGNTQRYTIGAMDEQERRRALLQLLVDHFAKGKRRALANRIEKAEDYVGRALYPAGKKGGKGIGDELMRACRDALPLPLGFWDMTPEQAQASLMGAITDATTDEPAEGYIRLEHMEPQPSMGGGANAETAVRIVRHLDVLEQWVRQKVGSTNPERIKILTGHGRSMSPTIHDQDLVFVDSWQHEIDMPGIYIVSVYNRLLLKRALILSDGTLILRSDNTEEYPDEERHDLKKAGDTIIIAGKVLAWWTLRQA